MKKSFWIGTLALAASAAGKGGCPRFYDLIRRRGPQYFYAFDMLWTDGRDLRGLPLIRRKRLLKKIVKSPVLFADHVTGCGVDLFQAACQRDLAGIVARGPRGCISRRQRPG